VHVVRAGGVVLAPGKGQDSVRPSSAAGLYYPKDVADLRRALGTLLGSGVQAMPRLPKALIVPHAGYAYSGEVAASAFRLLAGAAAASIRHVVLLGPSHRVKMRGLAMPSYSHFATPFGEVRINDAARQRLRELGLAGIADPPHALEHSLEVQVPFLQVVLGDFDLLPIAVGLAPPEQVGRALEAVWGGPETLIVVSSDLSHHHTHAEALALDLQTTRQVLERRSDLSDAQACGADSINGLMEVARHRGLDVQLLDRRTSGDTAGDSQRVVGYGSFALYAPG
jgi:AmmeMemoRadiSam system protein B